MKKNRVMKNLIKFLLGKRNRSKSILNKKQREIIGFSSKSKAKKILKEEKEKLNKSTNKLNKNIRDLFEDDKILF